MRYLAPEQWSLDGLATSVYSLFPNVAVSVLSKHSTVTVFEPISPTVTQLLIYRVTNTDSSGSSISLEEAKRDADFVKTAGLDEDREAACDIQAGLASNANTHLSFGHFEKAIAHFHQKLAAHLPII